MACTVLTYIHILGDILARTPTPPLSVHIYNNIGCAGANNAHKNDAIYDSYLYIGNNQKTISEQLEL